VDAGGAIRVTGASPTIIGCTLCDNESPGASGMIIDGATSSPVIENTIIAFNNGGEAVGCITSGSATLTCCDIYGNEGVDWGECIVDQQFINGNLWEDPLFCNAGAGDLRLQPESPCAPFSPPNDECDLIGAWPVGCASDVADREPSAAGFYLARCAPNPSRAWTRISYGIPATEAARSVVLRVHDASGRVVRTLVQSRRPGGVYHVMWDGADEGERPVANGMYFARLTWNGRSESRSLIVLR
jgi:hypothetical protein